jgi:hypothetical protein
LTYLDLKNHNNSESNSLGLSAQFGNKPNNPAMPDQLNLDLSLQGSKASSTTKATIGSGAINIGGSSATKEQTANLNRDITQTEANQKTVITSDFNATIKVPTMILNNPTEFKNQTKEGYDVLTSEEAKDIYGKVWASPNTVLGLTIGGVGYLYGAATGQEVKVSIGNNAIQFEGMPSLMVERPFTLGNTILYSGFGDVGYGPESPLYASYTNTYVGIDSKGNSVYPTVGDHEAEHTYQYQNLGPFFLPTYVVNGMINADKVGESIFSFPGHSGNTFETGADSGAIIKVKQREDLE